MSTGVLPVLSTKSIISNRKDENIWERISTTACHNPRKYPIVASSTVRPSCLGWDFLGAVSTFLDGKINQADG